MSACCWVLAVSGYVAAIECRRVQVERPRASTSGGQSEGMEGIGEALVVVFASVAFVVELGDPVAGLDCFVMASQEDTDVQVRQLLRDSFSSWSLQGGTVHFFVGSSYGLPSLSRTTPFGSGAWESSWFAPAGVLPPAYALNGS